MLQLQREKQQTNLSDKLNQLEARIKYTDDKINQLVFELYGLSEEEAGIVENVWTKIHKIEGWQDRQNPTIM